MTKCFNFFFHQLLCWQGSSYSALRVECTEALHLLNRSNGSNIDVYIDINIDRCLISWGPRHHLTFQALWPFSRSLDGHPGNSFLICFVGVHKSGWSIGQNWKGKSNALLPCCSPCPSLAPSPPIPDFGSSQHWSLASPLDFSNGSTDFPRRKFPYNKVQQACVQETGFSIGLRNSVMLLWNG